MKKLITLLMCALLLGATALITGCQGTPKQVAYKTLRSVGDSVDIAMKAYAEAVVAGTVDDAAQAKVRTLHNDYRAAFKQAVVAAKFDYETASPAQVSALAAELTSVIVLFIK